MRYPCAYLAAAAAPETAGGGACATAALSTGSTPHAVMMTGSLVLPERLPTCSILASTGCLPDLSTPSSWPKTTCLPSRCDVFLYVMNSWIGSGLGFGFS